MDTLNRRSSIGGNLPEIHSDAVSARSSVLAVLQGDLELCA